jgi:hypothetical protein
MPRALKAQEMQKNIELQKELQKIKDIKRLIESSGSDYELVSSGKDFLRILEEADSQQESISKFSLIDKAKKSQMAFNAFTTKSVLTRFGIPGINLDNLEQLYSPMLTGFGSMS